MLTRVDANPLMIKWAREDAGFSLEDLPAYLKNAHKWESGEEKPTWADLRNLAKKYKRPSFFYFLSKPPKDEDNFIEFRSEERIEEFSSDLRLEIRKAKFRRNSYINILSNMGMDIPNFKKLLFDESLNQLSNETVIKLAKHIRDYLGVTPKTQSEWLMTDLGNKSYNHSNFLNQWKEICFDLGILVFEMEKVSENEISACCIYYDDCPIILLNGKNNYNRRIFSLMHELAHLTIGNSAICDVNKHNKKEAFCNKVASEILIPFESLEKTNLFFKNGKLRLSSLSHMYGVSKQVIIYRLNSLNLISDDLKEKYIVELEEKNRLNRIKRQSKLKKSNPMIPIYVKKKKYDGSAYTKLVLDAYENQFITAHQAVRYLDTSIDKFESISAIVDR